MYFYTIFTFLLLKTVSSEICNNPDFLPTYLNWDPTSNYEPTAFTALELWPNQSICYELTLFENVPELPRRNSHVYLSLNFSGEQLSVLLNGKTWSLDLISKQSLQVVEGLTLTRDGVSSNPLLQLERSVGEVFYHEFNSRLKRIVKAELRRSQSGVRFLEFELDSAQGPVFGYLKTGGVKKHPMFLDSDKPRVILPKNTEAVQEVCLQSLGSHQPICTEIREVDSCKSSDQVKIQKGDFFSFLGLSELKKSLQWVVTMISVGLILFGLGIFIKLLLWSGMFGHIRLCWKKERKHHCLGSAWGRARKGLTNTKSKPKQNNLPGKKKLFANK